MKQKVLPSIILRAVLLLCGIFAVESAFVSDGGIGLTEDLLYFTYQSNIWVVLLTAVLLVLDLRRLKTERKAIPRGLQTVRYVVAVSISITMIVYWCILAPTRPTRSIFTLNSQLLHTIVPLLCIADFLLLDRGEPVGGRGALLALVPPLYYLIFTFTFQAATHYTFSSDRHYPYYILDVDRYGWFGTGAGIGVFWWLLIILCLTLALGYGYRLIQRETARAS